VTGTLTLTSGQLVTNADIVNVTSTSPTAVVHTGGWVIGNLAKAFAVGSGQSFTFPIGGSIAYTPAAVSNMNVTSAGSLMATVKQNDTIISTARDRASIRPRM
jgi:hypothetical protein